MSEPLRNVTLRLPIFTLPEARRQCIIMALQIADGDATAAAKLLGVSKSTIFRLIGDYRITKGERYKE
jgi:transcriptional regulator of acetoin/glycerol metabolism